MLIAAGTLAGYAESHKLLCRERGLEAVVRFVGAAQTEIRFSALPVEQLLGRHGEELGFMRLCCKRCAAGQPFSAAWAQSLRERPESFSKKDLELLRTFGERLGATDTEGQLAHCELYTQMFGGQLHAAREERAAKSKLCLMLGVSGGISAALVLC